MTKEMLDVINKVDFKLYTDGDRIVDAYESEYGIRIVVVTVHHTIHSYFYAECNGKFLEPLFEVL